MKESSEMMKTHWTVAAAVCGLLGLVSAASAGHGGSSADCCDTSCPTDCGKKVCTPTTEIKKVEKREYTDRWEDFCLPCSICGMLTHHCDCSKVHCRKLLIIKIKHCEKEVTKCVPVIEPACTNCAPSCGSHGTCSSCASGGTVVTGPAPTVLPAPQIPGSPHVPGPVTIPGGPAIQHQPLPAGAQPANNAIGLPVGR
jgi:hypothetical protein